MRLYDSARPTINHRFAYLSPKGKAIAPLPSLIMIPSPEDPEGDGLRVSAVCHLLTSPMGASQFVYNMHASDVVGFLHDWYNDPEEVLRSKFGYSYEPEGPKPRLELIPGSRYIPPIPTLEELGLA